MIAILLFGFLASLVISLFLGRPLIKQLKKAKARQSERLEGPASHKQKEGTPTMGGILLIGSTMITMILAMLIFHSVESRQWLAMILFLGNGAIGFFDDGIKAIKHRNLGLTAKQKLCGQALVAIVFCVLLHLATPFSTTLVIPGTSLQLDLGDFYYFFVFLMIVGSSNAVNLTDGLDGLAAGSCAITSAAYVIIAFTLGYTQFSLFPMVITGACLGFLYFNQHPAKVFMGDTGSLALGGALAAMAIVTKTELLLLLVGALYVLEALSVILQVLSFKLRGVRIFKMSPIHHHFELSGWSEVKVVSAFWFFSAVVAIFSILLVVWRY